MIARLRTAFHLQLLPLALGFVLLAAIVGSRSWLIETQRDENDAVRAAFELDNRIVTTLSLIQDAETGQRGFLLDGRGSLSRPLPLGGRGFARGNRGDRCGHGVGS